MQLSTAEMESGGCVCLCVCNVVKLSSRGNLSMVLHVAASGAVHGAESEAAQCDLKKVFNV